MASQNNGDDHDARTIHCANLSERVSDALLYELFLQAGPLERVSIPKEKDGTQRSYGFITYKHLESVQYAIGIFNGTKLFNREIRMNNRCANNTNGNRNIPNQVESMQQKTQIQLQQFYQMQNFQLQLQQQLPPKQPNLLQNEILSANFVNQNQQKPPQERNERNERSVRNRERDRSRDKDGDRQRKRDRSKDISALKGPTALPNSHHQSMLPAANPFAKKIDDVSNKAFDINALLNFGTNMFQSNQSTDNEGHNLQSKMMHRHESRPHHQNANYSRWSGGTGRDDRRGGDRRGHSDFNRRNRHDRR